MDQFSTQEQKYSNGAVKQGVEKTKNVAKSSLGTLGEAAEETLLAAKENLTSDPIASVILDYSRTAATEVVGFAKKYRYQIAAVTAAACVAGAVYWMLQNRKEKEI